MLLTGDDGDGNLVWEDTRRHGFVAADGGHWYTRVLSQLKPGSRIFVCIPKHGYVGVGKITGSVKPISDFNVMVDGIGTPVLEAPGLQGHYESEHIDDPDMCAYFVPVEWLKTVSKDSACWEKGMYANQNTVTKLRNKFTLEHLISFFSLQDG